jgi:DNA-binding NarL/FixJ family response regulator
MPEFADELHVRQPMVLAVGAMPSVAASLQQSWTRSCALYRQALTTYALALEIRSTVGRNARRSVIEGQSARKHVKPAEPKLARVTLLKANGGLTRLSRREREVATLIARGLSNQQIAEILIIERGTVANHVAHILDKLGLSNRTQVATWLLHNASGSESDCPRAAER